MMTASRKDILRKRRPLIVVAGRKDRPIVPEIKHVIAEAAREADWDLLDLSFTFWRLPQGRKPDGAMISALPDEPLAWQLRRMGCPAVRLGQLPHPKDSLLPAVVWDVGAFGRMAAEHFVERGFKHVGYVGLIPWSMGRLHYAAFTRCAEALGCEVHLLRTREPVVVAGEEKYKQQSEKVLAWLQSLPKPIGIMTVADRLAGRLLAICEEHGIRVPDEVAVLTGNNSIDCEMTSVPLSSLVPANQEYAETALGLLKDLMAGKEPTCNPIRIAPKGLVTRRSTDVLAVGDPLVAAAMRFMWDHLDQDLSVDEIARAVAGTRRTLERAFRHSLHRGIVEELRRKRLEVCCELLEKTDLSIADIAPRVGFSTPEYLHTTFKRFMGMTPRAYRLGKATS